MNDRKFAFIICVNNDLYFEECKYYISKLHVPEGYETDILEIREADSMCAAYNLGMQSTDAKYKIYMHQDVFIINEYFLRDILERFRKCPEVGMIGMFGGTRLPKNGIVFDSWNEGKCDVREPDMAYHLYLNESTDQDIVVEAVDGSMMATQYDVLWREDLFSHFDFYDVSQSLEFKKAGYQILVPYQEKPWMIHDCSFCKLGGYDEDRRIFLKHYSEFLSAERESGLLYNKEWDELSSRLADCIREMLESGEWKEAVAALQIYHQKKFKDTDLEILSNMAEIYQLEKKSGVLQTFFAGIGSYKGMYEKYIRTRFLLRRMELGFERAAYGALEQEIANESISYDAVTVLMIHSVADKMAVIRCLKNIYKESGQIGNLKRLELLTPSIAEMGIPVTSGKRAAQKSKRHD